MAQVTTDGTTSTTVTSPDGSNFTINDGDRAGANLFHSFQDFSVPINGSASFNNAVDIQNIFSRVTGGKISNIDGLIKANGSANLFLINPAGIIFGQNARLDIGGSFLGSTADNLLFPEGEFSAVDLDNPPLLTINAPIGLGIRDNPGDIVNQSVANDVGLQVNEGEAISLVGGNVSLEGGFVTAPGGTVQVLGDFVSLLENAKIDVSSDTGGGQVFIGGNFQGQNSLVNAIRTYIDSNVNINADALTNGNGGRVIVWADEVTGFYGNISARGGSVSGNGGFVEVSGKKHLIFRGHVDTTALNGFPGTLLLDPTNIVIANGSGDEVGDGTDTLAGNNSNQAGSILSTPLSDINDTAPTTIYESELEGLSGDTNVILQATNDITIQDLADDELNFARGSAIVALTADADRNGIGDFVMEDNIADTIKTNGRSIAISGANLTLGNIDTSLGNIDNSLVVPDNAGSSIETAQFVSNGSGVSLESISGTFSSTDSADVYQIFLTGNGTFSASTVDGTTIDTQLFLFDAGGFGIYGNDDRAGCDCFQSTLPAGDILTPTLPGIYFLAISEFGVEPVSTEGRIFPDAFDTESVDFESIVTPTAAGGALPLIGFDSEGFSEGNYTIALTGVEGTVNTFNEIFNETEQIAEGNGGTINLDATNGSISVGNLISSSGSLEGGTTTLNASGDILIDGNIDTSANLGNSGNVQLDAQGNITVMGSFFDVIDDSNNITIDTTTIEGDAGNININSGGNIELNAVSIETNSPTGSLGDTQTGNININANQTISLQGGQFATITGDGEGGGLQITGSSIDINETRIFTSTVGAGNGGNITITANNQGTVKLENVDLFTTVFDIGNGGNITLKGGAVDIIDAFILGTTANSSAPGLGDTGDSGTVSVIATSQGSINIDSSIVNIFTSQGGNGGNINLEGGAIDIADSGFSVETRGAGDAGIVNIKGSEVIQIKSSYISSSSLNDLITTGNGNAGDINLSSPTISVTNVSTISSSTAGTGDAGNIFINTDSFKLAGQNEFGRISGLSVETLGMGNAGSINLNTSQLIVEDGGRIAASTSGQGNGGNIILNASNLFLTDRGQIISNTSGEGNAGNITINAAESVIVYGTNPDFLLINDLVTFAPSSISTSVEAMGTGNGGEINITTTNLSLTNGGQINVTSSGQGNGGEVLIQADALTLNNGSISAANNPSTPIPTNEASRSGGNINLNIRNNLTLDNESTISARSGLNASGGNIDINAQFVIAAPNQNNDIIASAEQGIGGNIDITAEGVFGLEKRSSTPPNNTNDIDASSEFGLDGTVSINTPDISSLQEAIEPPKIVELQTLGLNACSSSGELGSSSFELTGKGGVPPQLTAPLNSNRIFIEGESTSISLEQTERLPTEQIKPLVIAQGKIYPARGIVFLENGDIILTAYPTDNVRRIPHSSANCRKS